MSDYDPEAFGRRIYLQRVSRRMKQSDLAQQVGKLPQYISHVEAGKHKKMDPAVLVGFAKIFSTSTDYLLMGDCGTDEVERSPAGVGTG